LWPFADVDAPHTAPNQKMKQTRKHMRCWGVAQQFEQFKFARPAFTDALVASIAVVLLEASVRWINMDRISRAHSCISESSTNKPEQYKAMSRKLTLHHRISLLVATCVPSD
jgi:hypothetical protein